MILLGEFQHLLMDAVQCEGVSDMLTDVHDSREPDVSGKIDRRALETRRSCRAFSAKPIRRDHLLEAVAAALVADHVDWPAEWSANNRLDALLLVQSVEDLASGVYHYGDDLTALNRPVRPGFSLQSEFERSAAVVVFRGRLDRSVERHGGHGYRQLLVRGGSAGSTCALHAITYGLASCSFDAIVPEGIDGVAGTDGVRWAGLFAAALGYPRDDAGGDRIGY